MTETGGPSGGDARHLPAFFGTVPTRGGTVPAVVLGMRLAFAGTGVTHVGANAANVLHELRFAGQERRAESTQFAAVNAQARAVRHGLQTGSGTLIARLGAMEAGIDARLK